MNQRHLSPADRAELGDLLSLLREGLISHPQEIRLSELVGSSDEAMRQYILTTGLAADLRGRLVRAALPVGMRQEETTAPEGQGAQALQETLIGSAISLPRDDEEELVSAPMILAPRPSGFRHWIRTHPKSVSGAVAAMLLLAACMRIALSPGAPASAT
jgi:hypothetical protein